MEYSGPGRGKLLILTGMPASGKTTIARRLAEIADDVFIVSSDDIRKKSGRKVWEKMESMVQEGLESGMVVVADATNYDKRRRDRFAGVAGVVGCPFWVGYIRAGTEVLLERNADRTDSIPQSAIYHFSRSFQEPGPEEGAIVIDTEYLSAEEAARKIALEMGLSRTAGKNP
ncbi:MAG: AAA family ATPase [Theionarchaea archaeon]|nr:AAA family ATPase [Theionarchaea archaeon]